MSIQEYNPNFEISEPLKEIITVAQEKKVDTMRQRLNTDAFELYAELFLHNALETQKNNVQFFSMFMAFFWSLC